jgi:hypothetical protein
MQSISRQAVVIIHGMGEQRPNITLRGFVKCLVDKIGQKTGAKPVLFDKPDKISDTYETRSMSMLADKAAGRPTTHFYEFYWAYHMRDSNWGEIIAWIKGLVFRSPARIPPRIRKVYRWIWGILILCIIAVIAYTQFHTKIAWIKYLTGLGGLAILGRAVLGFLQSAVIKTLGDAARYMSDYPDNIEQRQAIRREGIDLLRHLHTATDDLGEPLYDRIVVASHSLGTVIAYDLLRLLWVEYSETFDNSLPGAANPAMKKMEDPAYQVTNGYQKEQNECWSYQRMAGNKWLITDLVTMGCPLAYFDYLIVNDPVEFQRRKTEREYPTCPPQLDKKYGLHWPVRRRGNPDPIELLSYSSPFACTRWTNLFFDTDFIGGPLQPVLGSGIIDIPIATTARARWLPYPFGHTDYWDGGNTRFKAYDEIIAALKLNANPPAAPAGS